jgi:hypothetical protein
MYTIFDHYTVIYQDLNAAIYYDCMLEFLESRHTVIKS